jgi:hypothetical protein
MGSPAALLPVIIVIERELFAVPFPTLREPGVIQNYFRLAAMVCDAPIEGQAQSVEVQYVLELFSGDANLVSCGVAICKTQADQAVLLITEPQG